VASTGLKKWFKEKWVDIGRPKKKGRYQPCGRGKAKTSRKGYPKCVPLARARTMSKAQKRSARRWRKTYQRSHICKERQKTKNYTKKKKIISIKQLDHKLELAYNLMGIEKAVASLIIESRQKLTNLKKLKDYASMNRCVFRDEQLKKLVGE
jgi:hypothetical protein